MDRIEREGQAPRLSNAGNGRAVVPPGSPRCRPRAWAWAFKLLAACVVLLASPHSISAAAPGPTRFFVAPQGDDRWTGTAPEPTAAPSDGPFATVQRAVAAVRAARQAAGGQLPGRPVIEVRGGTYYLEATIELLPEDSGLILRAYRGERPVLSGGVAIANWQTGRAGVWKAHLPEVRTGEWQFTQLFVNDQRRFRPRLPESGYYKIAGELEPSSEAGGRGVDRFVFGGDDIRADWTHLNDVEVLAFHSWSMSRLPIKAVDAERKIVSFHGTSPGKDWWGKFPKGNRYLVENVREALRRPGQWYLDRGAGELLYLPREGETPEQARVVAPRLEQILVFAGDVEGGRPVQNVLLQGLTFAHAAWRIPRTGQSIPQAEINLGAALSATGARDLVIENCAVRNVGAYALAFGAGCRDNRVEGCELVDLGAGGVKIGATALSGWGDLQGMARSEEPMISHHTVRDCTIAHGGRLHPAAIGVWIGHSPYNVIEHNEIYDLYYSATSIGWVWGYARSHAHHNRVTFNHMHTLGQGVLSDMGAVYTLGISPGTVVSDNHIHDVHAFDYGGWGLYTDEGSTGVTMENNLVYRTKTGGFHQHYGRENRIVNNLLAYSRTDQMQRSRVEDHVSFTFERNVVLYDRGELLGKSWADDRVWLDHNLYWNSAGPVRFPGGKTLEQWRQSTGHDRSSIIADPGFIDAAKDDFRLRPDSPARALGFVPFDASRAGRRTPVRLTGDLPPVPKAFE